MAAAVYFMRSSERRKVACRSKRMTDMVKSHSITIALISLFVATCLTGALMAAKPDKPAVAEPRT